jgi:hypothetical protein
LTSAHNIEHNRYYESSESHERYTGALSASQIELPGRVLSAEGAASDLRDRQDISDLLIRYAMALDARDWSLLRTCFTRSAVAEYGTLGLTCEGVDAIIETCRRELGGLDSSQHLVGNFVVEVNGGEACATSYLHAQHYLVSATGDNTFVVAGTYRDRIARTPEGWRIVHRKLEPSWTSGNAGLVSEGAARLAEREAEAAMG